MPIRLAFEDQVIHTILVGRVTDEELLSHYARPEFQEARAPWRELVDGREITAMAVTAAGQRKLAAYAAASAQRLRGGRVAMLASTEVTYGMFRMWEIQREGLGYAVSVFRDFEEARQWLLSPQAGS